MSSARCSTLALLAAAFLIMRPVVAAQWNASPYFTTFAPANDISFTISTDRTSYVSGDPIPMKYEITNVSGRPLFVPNTVETPCFPTFHLHAWLEGADGHYGGGSPGGFIISCGRVQQTVTQRMKDGAYVLKPGNHVEETVPLNTKGLPPGVYRIGAVFSLWKPEEFSPAEQEELAKMGAPFVRGEVWASAKVTLTSAVPQSTPTSGPTEASPPQSSIPLVVVHPFSDEISDLRVKDQGNGILIELDGESVTSGQPFAHPFSTMNLQVWLLLRNGRTVPQKEQPAHVGLRNSYSSVKVDAMQFLFDHFVPTELAGVVVSVNGKMYVRQIHVPAIPRRTPEREQQASR